MTPRPADRRIVLVGFGPVGRAFARLVDERGPDTAGRRPVIVAVVTRRGTWLRAEAGPGSARATSISTTALADAIEHGTPMADLAGVRADFDAAQAIAGIAAEVLVEASPTDLETGEPGVTHIRAALARGWDVVSASKGALVIHGPELVELARQHGARLRYGAAAAAALPTLIVARRGLAGARVERIDGILNGTSNAILTMMRRDGLDFAGALARAQAAGIAERDPGLDVGGWDTAAKLVLIAGAVWDAPVRLADVAIEGIEAVTRDDHVTAGERAETIRLVGSASIDDGGRPRLRVAPASLGTDHPLAHVDGSEKGVTYTTDTLGRITLTGGASSPVGAAAAILRDILGLDAEE